MDKPSFQFGMLFECVAVRNAMESYTPTRTPPRRDALQKAVEEADKGSAIRRRAAEADFSIPERITSLLPGQFTAFIFFKFTKGPTADAWWFPVQGFFISFQEGAPPDRYYAPEHDVRGPV